MCSRKTGSLSTQQPSGPHRGRISLDSHTSRAGTMKEIDHLGSVSSHIRLRTPPLLVRLQRRSQCTHQCTQKKPTTWTSRDQFLNMLAIIRKFNMLKKVPASVNPDPLVQLQLILTRLRVRFCLAFLLAVIFHAKHAEQAGHRSRPATWHEFCFHVLDKFNAGG